MQCKARFRHRASVSPRKSKYWLVIHGAGLVWVRKVPPTEECCRLELIDEHAALLATRSTERWVIGTPTCLATTWFHSPDGSSESQTPSSGVQSVRKGRQRAVKKTNVNFFWFKQADTHWDCWDGEEIIVRVHHLFLDVIAVSTFFGSKQENPMQRVQKFRLRSAKSLHVLDSVREQSSCTVHYVRERSLHQSPTRYRLQCWGQRWWQSKVNVLNKNLFEGFASFLQFLLRCATKTVKFIEQQAPIKL